MFVVNFIESSHTTNVFPIVPSDENNIYFSLKNHTGILAPKYVTFYTNPASDISLG